MNTQLWLKVVLATLSYMIFTSPALAALKFKSEWYFDSQERIHTPVGVQESAVPYSDDRRLEGGGIEYSLADLQKRAEALDVWWLREMDITTSSTGEGEILTATQESASAPLIEALPQELEEESLIAKVQSTAIDVVPMCEGIYFDLALESSVYVVATDELIAGEQLQECVELETGSHDLLWLPQNAEPIGIRTYGHISTQHRLSYTWVDTLQKDEFNVGVWVPEWTSSDEDVEILVDGELLPEDLFVAHITPEGMALFFEFDNGVRELRIVNHARDETYDLLIHAESQHDKIAVLGSVILDDVQPSLQIQFTAQSDPTRFLQYYNEDVGVFFDIPSGFSFLKNKTMPHFFRYYDSQTRAKRTFLWEPRTKHHSSGVGDAEDGTFNLHQVLTSIRSKREMGLDLENNLGMDLLVVSTPLELAPPQISQVRVDEDGIQWHQLLHTYVWEAQGMTTQVFANPPEGEYWLDNTSQSRRQKIWVMKGMDTMVGWQDRESRHANTNN